MPRLRRGPHRFGRTIQQFGPRSLKYLDVLNFDSQLLKLLLPAMHNPVLIRQYLLKLQGTPLPVPPVLQYRKEVLAQAA